MNDMNENDTYDNILDCPTSDLSSSILKINLNVDEAKNYFDKVNAEGKLLCFEESNQVEVVHENQPIYYQEPIYSASMVQFVYTSLNRDEWLGISAIFTNFIEEYAKELNKSRSFVVTPVIKNKKSVCIFVGAEKHSTLKLPRNYQNIEILVSEDSVVLSGKRKEFSDEQEDNVEEESINEYFAQDLTVACDIGPANSSQKLSGTLGCFVQVSSQDNSQKRLYGLTCFHVVDGLSTHFYQPSQTILDRCNIRIKDRHRYLAGSGTNYGFGGMYNNEYLDYKLLWCQRNIIQPLNSFTLRSNGEATTRKILPVQIDLNKKEDAEKYLKSKRWAAKLGAQTDFKLCQLHNFKREHCLIKTQSTESQPSFEMAFLSNTRFFERGDSGSIIFDNDSSSVLGLAFACCTASNFAFMTPFSSIQEHFQLSFNKKLTIA